TPRRISAPTRMSTTCMVRKASNAWALDIGTLAAQGRLVIGPVLFSVLGTAAFLAFCFTIGGRWVARIIRWTNDHFVIEMPVISVILVIMIALALVTNFIGVHTVLGAFAAGIMIGQSPILTKHIEEQLRGLIMALFMPVFFGVAGLAIDLKVLSDPHLLGFALLLIGIASIGKLGGCYLGSRIARLNHPEALSPPSSPTRTRSNLAGWLVGARHLTA